MSWTCLADQQVARQRLPAEQIFDKLRVGKLKNGKGATIGQAISETTIVTSKKRY